LNIYWQFLSRTGQIVVPRFELFGADARNVSEIIPLCKWVQKKLSPPSIIIVFEISLRQLNLA